MASISQWTPYGVALTITATVSSVSRISATQFKATFNVSWKPYWSGASTNYGMRVTAGGGSTTLNNSGNYSTGSSGTVTGTFSINSSASGNTNVTVTFINFQNDYNGNTTSSASQNLTVTVNVPAVTKYTLTFNPNGGTLPNPGDNLYSSTNSGNSVSVTVGTSSYWAMSKDIPTRYGYTFKGWYTATSGGEQVYDSSGYAIAGGTYWDSTPKWKYYGNLTVYAQWSVITYSITYDSNGGSGVSGTVYKNHGSNITLTTSIPTRYGYNFKGWSTNSNASSATYAAGATYSANSSATLYAVWEAKTITIYLKSNDSNNYSATQYLTYGSSNLTFGNTGWARANYSLLGYSTSNSATSAAYSPSAQVSNDWIVQNYPSITLYAVWRQDGSYLDINIHYGDIVYTSGSTQMTEEQAKAILTVNVSVGGSTVASNVCDYYAIHPVGSSYQVTYALRNSNYTVYRTERLSGTISSSSTSVEIYLGLNHTVTYNANGGSGAPGSQTKKYGTALQLSSTVPTRSGYTFIGWAVSSSTRKISYSPSGYYNSENDITLYAIWVSNSIIFRNDGTIEVVNLVESTSYENKIVFGKSDYSLNCYEIEESDITKIIFAKNGKVTAYEFVEKN